MTLHFASFSLRFIACMIALLQVTTVEAKIYVYNQDGEKIESFSDREAQFGAVLVEPIQGFIVAAEPSDACTMIAGPTFFTNFTVGKFVLINGTEKCSSILKVRNAEKAGFNVAVIFDPNPLPLQYIHIVPFPGPEMKIQVLFISFEDGIIIRNKYQYNNSFVNNYILEITPNNQDMSYYLMLFALVIGVCFLVMLLFMICLLIKCIQERRKSRRNRLSSRQIKQVPTAKFSKGDQYDVCAICLEDYNEGDKLRILPCEHAYHARCVDPWLMNNRRNCPLCKRKITFGDSASDSESEDSELTSPAENTPLIASPANHGQSWGTFAINPVNPLSNAGFNEQTEQPNTSQYPANFSVSPASMFSPNAEIFDEEFIACLPPSDCSVNNTRENSPTGSASEITVHVSFTPVVESNGSTTLDSQHGFIV